MSTPFPSLHSTRRRFIAGAGAGAVSATFGLPKVYAQSNGGAVRKRIDTPGGKRDLELYRQAVKKLLALPLEDPRNWYRLAFIHIMDCPHRNWWFLVWHRGYLGFVERICRDILNEPDFALPFWDWTNQPELPAAFNKGALNVNGPDFFPNLNAFHALRPVMQAYWSGMSPEQATQQTQRWRHSDFDRFWTEKAEDAFAKQPKARLLSAHLSQAEIDLLKHTPAVRAAAVKDAGKDTIIKDVLTSDRFATERSRPGFESMSSPSHHQGSKVQSTLESQPHNIIHGAVGGFMSNYLSPVDPIFFMHHCNIDRLWDVWTRKQIAEKRPIGPEVGEEADAYFKELFLFFVNEDGEAVDGAAQDYFSVESFAYSYAEGFGEALIPQGGGEALIPQGAPIASLTPASADGGQAEIGVGRQARVNLTASPELAGRLRIPEQSGFFAMVTITPEDNANDFVFEVLIGPKNAAEGAGGGLVSAGGFAFFGAPHSHDGGHAPQTFTISISEALQELRERGVLGQELEVSVTATANPDIAPNPLAPTSVQTMGKAGALQSVSIGAL